MQPPSYQTARALHPPASSPCADAFITEALAPPLDHPEFDLWGIEAIRRQGLEDPGFKESIAPLTEPKAGEAEPLRARMLNEFVYCPRLFYYEQIEGVFVPNADTERGKSLHEKVDRGKGSLPRARQSSRPAAPAGDAPLDDLASPAGNAEGNNPDEAGADPSDSAELEDLKTHQPAKATETIHSRSAMMSSRRLGVIAKMDLVEVKVAAISGPDLFFQAARAAEEVRPVDYKAGSPRQGPEGNELWDADKMQLGLQILILRDNGYACEEGIIYYHGTKQRVPLRMTAEIEGWIESQIEKAKALMADPKLPPPLQNSPKCPRCSLAPVCLPDETRLLQQAGGACNGAAGRGPWPTLTSPPRRLMAARDDERALYLNSQGCRVGVKSERLIIKEGDSVLDEVRLADVAQVSLFGNIQLSTQAIQTLCEAEVPVAYFSMGGWFYGLTRGHGLKNVHNRIRQFAVASQPLACLQVAQRIVQAKIRNHRTMLMRLHTQPPATAVQGLREIAARVVNARGLDELLGMEGAAAALYFQNFGGLIKVGADEDEDEIPGLESEASRLRVQQRQEAFTFEFTHRRRRPPTDPVNALLSLAYSLLAKDCTLAALAVGLDPYVGFYHQPRHGRPALALDLMEEFRPLIAESAVLSAINNRMVNPAHFVRAGEAVNLTADGRRAFFHAYEQRTNALITHPVFDYKVSYRRVIELQARLLARWLTGEIPEYVPMVTR